MGHAANVIGGVAGGPVTGDPGRFGLDSPEYATPDHTYLHDGRAQSIEEAILWHGGEADSSRENDEALSETEREQLLQFLRSL